MNARVNLKFQNLILLVLVDFTSRNLLFLAIWSCNTIYHIAYIYIYTHTTIEWSENKFQHPLHVDISGIRIGGILYTTYAVGSYPSHVIVLEWRQYVCLSSGVSYCIAYQKYVFWNGLRLWKLSIISDGSWMEWWQRGSFPYRRRHSNYGSRFDLQIMGYNTWCDYRTLKWITSASRCTAQQKSIFESVWASIFSSINIQKPGSAFGDTCHNWEIPVVGGMTNLQSSWYGMY